jgi:hypothetical protein
LRKAFVDYFLRTYLFPEGILASSVLVHDLRAAGGWVWVDLAPCYQGFGEVDDPAVNDCAEGGTYLYRVEGGMWLQAAIPERECLEGEFSLDAFTPACARAIRDMYPGVPGVLLPRARPVPRGEAAAAGSQPAIDCGPGDPRARRVLPRVRRAPPEPKAVSELRARQLRRRTRAPKLERARRAERHPMASRQGTARRPPTTRVPRAKGRPRTSRSRGGDPGMKLAALYAIIAFAVAALGFTLTLRFLARDDVDPGLMNELALQLSFWLAALPAFLIGLLRARRRDRAGSGVPPA